jgi:hypothetical protein
MINLFVPSSLILSDGVFQLAFGWLVLCCTFQSDEGEGQRMTTVFVEVLNIASDGGGGTRGGET